MKARGGKIINMVLEGSIITPPRSCMRVNGWRIHPNVALMLV